MNLKKIVADLVGSCDRSLEQTILSLLPCGIEWVKTPLNTIQVTIPGEKDEVLLLDAHMDTIGFVVTNITADGFLKVAPCGGVDCRVLSGSEVTVLAKQPLYGVFTIMPPHLKNTSSEAVPVEELAIDIGLTCQQATQQVEIGDRVIFRPRITELSNQRIAGCGLDNLAGVAVLISLAHQLQQSPPVCSVVLQFSTFEETGHRYAGAVTGAFSVQPSQTIVVDAGFAAVQGLRYATPGEMGKGVMVGFSPMLSSKISRCLCDLALKQGIGCTRDVMGGASGTNADGICSTGVGVPTGLVSYPLLNMHTGVEVVSLDDLNETVCLLRAYCQERGNGYEE